MTIDFSKFRNSGVAAVPSTGAAAPSALSQFYVPRNTGVTAQDRDPFPRTGTYLFRVIETSDSSVNRPSSKVKGFFKVRCEVIASEGQTANKPGDTVSILQCVTGDAEDTGKKLVKTFLIKACGFDKEADFDLSMRAPLPAPDGTPDPGGAIFWDACSQIPGAEAFYGKQPLAGALVVCQVSTGNERKKNGVGTGEYYSNYTWAVAPPAAAG